MPTAPSGTNWIAGGAAAAVLLPALVIGLAMPFWIAALVSIVAGGGVIVLFSPQKLFARLDASGAAQGKIDFARELLTEAAPLADRLDAAATSIRAKNVADRVRHLAGCARDIFAAIESEPLHIDRVRRFLTYYLPRAAEFAEAFAAIERRRIPDTVRLKATGELIDRLDAAFTRFATNLQDASLGNLDIELKLLKRSLDEDYGPAQVASPPHDPARG
jgi:5-bromo-4-chloroindolyl phosphate hydrolysis protein